MWGPNHQGEAGSWRFPPDCVTPRQGWGLWQEFVSAFPICFHVGIFSFVWCVGVTQLVSVFFSERIFLCVDVQCVHLRRETQELPMLPSWNICYLFYSFNPLYSLALLKLKFSHLWPMGDFIVAPEFF